MGTKIKIWDVPQALHRELTSRASRAGMSLSDYLFNDIREIAGRPTLDELQARLDRRAGATVSVAPADAVRAEREQGRGGGRGA